MTNKNNKKFFIAVSVLIGTCIGAGVLGIPYVAAQSGFFVALGYIFLIGFLILIVNLYLGEIALRTKGNHQLIGYAKKYIGKKGKHFMEFAIVFGIYAAIVAYLIGIGNSLSFLIFGNGSYGIYFGVVTGLLMAWLLKGGIKSLKKFEKMGVLIILVLLVVIFIIFSGKIEFMNLLTFNKANIFLPFGVILFALMSFSSIPEVKIILKKDEKIFKKVLITGTLVSIIFYALFAFVVLGFSGANTPEIATLALGTIFVVLGIFTMFTSYLAVGTALIDNFKFDERYGENSSWFLVSIVPIGIFVLTQLTDFFSFTRILSIGGVVSGGIMAIMVLLIIKKAKKKGNRKPEYSIPVKWWVMGLLSLIFILGVVREILLDF